MLNRVHGSRGNWEIDEADAPDPRQRSYLERRSNDLAIYLAPASREDVIREIGVLFRMMAVRDCEPEEMSAVIEVYVQDLRGLPLWAVSESCRAFRAGEAGEGTFAPKVGELRRHAVKLVQRWRDERDRIERVLSSRIIPRPAEEHAVIAERVRKMASACIAELQRAGDPERFQGPIKPEDAKSEAERAEEWLAAAEVVEPPAIILSDEAKRLVGIA